MATDDQLLFEDRDAFREWLLQNYDTSPGIWLVLGKGGKVKTLTADEALEEALCFGWIDGQLKSVDDRTYVKRFTPRRKGSVWSERNRELASDLIQRGMMTEAGQAAIDAAKAKGTWDRPGPAPVTEDQVGILIEALSGEEPALTNFLAMPFSVRRIYTALYLDAKKEETRKKRLAGIIQRLNENKKPM